MRELPDGTQALDEDDLEALEIGSGILGTGGGGNPYIGKLRARQVLRAGYDLCIQPLDTLRDEASVVPLGGIGAPLVSFERIKEGREGLRCLRALEQRLGFAADAIGCEEIGGQNSMEPLVIGALAGLPVVDGDGMGRAFPEMQMTTYAIYGHRSTPSVMCDPHGNIVIFDHAITEKWHEIMARACVVAQGGASVLASAPMTGAFMKRYAIPHTYTQAIDLGRAVIEARRTHADPIEAICTREGGRHVFSGKITDLQRHFKGGFNVGVAQISGLDAFAGSSAEIVIQNEFLIFSRDGEMQVCVPDLVVVLDLESGLPLTTEVLRYGQRVAILALPSHPLLRTDSALEVIGPAAFGHPEYTFNPIPAKEAAE